MHVDGELRFYIQVLVITIYLLEKKMFSYYLGKNLPPCLIHVQNWPVINTNFLSSVSHHHCFPVMLVLVFWQQETFVQLPIMSQFF